MLLVLAWPLLVMSGCDYLISSQFPNKPLKVSRPTSITNTQCVGNVVLTDPTTNDQYCVRKPVPGQAVTNKLTCRRLQGSRLTIVGVDCGLAQNHPNYYKLGLFWNPQDLLLKMARDFQN